MICGSIEPEITTSGFISPTDHGRANALAAQGLVTWVNYPELGRARGQYDQPQFALGSRWMPLEGILAVEEEHADDLVSFLADMDQDWKQRDRT